MIQFMKQESKLPVTVIVDNKGEIFISENVIVKITKHIDAQYHVIWEYIEDGFIKLQFITSIENKKDIYTKNTSIDIFETHSDDFLHENK